jgi:hypothetical protein
MGSFSVCSAAYLQVYANIQFLLQCYYAHLTTYYEVHSVYSTTSLTHCTTLHTVVVLASSITELEPVTVEILLHDATCTAPAV